MENKRTVELRATTSSLLQLHKRVVDVVAEFQGLQPKDLMRQVEKALNSNLSDYAKAAATTAQDREQALIVSLAACYVARQTHGKKVEPAAPPPDLKLVYAIYDLRDDLHRDVTYSYYWMKQPFAAIAKGENLKQLTVAQNHKRALKELVASYGEHVEQVLDGWRSQVTRFEQVNDDPQEILKTLLSRSDGKNLSAAAMNLLVCSFASVSHAFVTSVGFALGARSIRETHGRPIISLDERLGLYEKEMVVAKEDQGRYDRTRQYYLTNANEDWQLTVVHVYNKQGAQEISFALKSQDRAVVILSEKGEQLGTCTPAKPFFNIDQDELPFEFSVRVIGTN